MDYRVEEIAARTGLRVDTIRFYQFRGLLPRPRSFQVTGIFASGMSDYDEQWAFVSLPEARRLLAMEEGASVILVRVNEVGRLEETREALAGELAVMVGAYTALMMFRAGIILSDPEDSQKEKTIILWNDP